MSMSQIDSFLEKTIGLSAEAIGPKGIAKAVGLRMAALGVQDVAEYYACLSASEREQGALIEAVVVPETWFFRNKKAFRYLVDHVTGTWLKQNSGRRLRALSLPCSTGEEAYSIAMALKDAGMSTDRFQVDGVDISEAALDRASAALYDQASFRGDDLSFRDRCFDPEGHAFRLHEDIRKPVRFLRGNILNEGILADQGPYDVIFCRNLLIYMSPQAKERTLGILTRLLADSGILFLGHAEREAAVSWGLVGIPEFGVFACRKERRKQTRTPTTLPHPRRRRFEKVGSCVQPARPRLEPAAAAKPPDTPAPWDRGPDNHGEKGVRADLFDEAQRLADRGSLQTALDLCRSFLTDHPIHVEAHFLMGLIYEALDSEEKAEESFNKAIYLDPNHSEALNHLSFIVENRGDASQAAHLRERAHRALNKGAQA